jgi:APA family basic amino acid/polyamine antiporter
MIVMGGIVGSGIFMNPSVVAGRVHTPLLILVAWAAGGAIAMAGAFIWAELSSRMPKVGGQYAYLREAYHPAVAFLYGWVLLLVIQTGGMAAVAITFATYSREITGLPMAPATTAVLALGGLAAVNCLGLKAGSSLQSALMVLKIAAILGLVGGGAWFLLRTGGLAATPPAPAETPPVRGLLAAMVPVLFAYGGWQTSTFVSEEIRDARRTLPRALVTGVLAVIALYVAVNLVCVGVLGVAGLAGTSAPASAVMQRALGRPGATLIAVGIAISTLGFLSQSILTAPRVYFAMARDGVFFRSVGWLDPKRGVPTVAILLQAALAIVIALSGRYEQILGYVVSMDFIFFGLTATCIFVFRKRGNEGSDHAGGFARVPGHPVTTALFVAVSWIVVANTIVKYPADTAIGMGILLTGIPVYFLWSRKGKTP